VSVNEFIKSMAAEGFSGTFRATNGEHTYRGSIEDGKISIVKVQTVAESQQKIKELFGDDKR
jgi:hypothetical protein